MNHSGYMIGYGDHVIVGSHHVIVGDNFHHAHDSCRWSLCGIFKSREFDFRTRDVGMSCCDTS
jgi:hypothetical protein